MSLVAEEAKTLYPLHWLVWNNHHEDLEEYLKSSKAGELDLERTDPRGRTALLLAATLGYGKAARELLRAGASPEAARSGWSAVHEATALARPALLRLLLANRRAARSSQRAALIPALLKRLALTPDFYLELRWELASWLPLVQRLCPPDSFRVYKRGGRVRIDAAPLGSAGSAPAAATRSFIFHEEANGASLTELDHESRARYTERIADGSATPPSVQTPSANPVPSSALTARLRAPLQISYLDTDEVSFEKALGGMWGWRRERVEVVCGRSCRVLAAHGAALVTRSRSEHLESAPTSATPAPLAALISLIQRPDTEAETEPETEPDPPIDVPEEYSDSDLESPDDLRRVSWDEYMDTTREGDVGVVRREEEKRQNFRGTLWMADDYPLQLQEQVSPLLELVCSAAPRLDTVREFVSSRLPPGFPVKIEIPLFHVVSARVTFCNVFGLENAVPHVSTIQEDARLTCLIDDACFEIGRGYRTLGQPQPDEDDALLHYAIHQSLLQQDSLDKNALSDQVDVWEALRGSRPSSRASPSRHAAAPSPTQRLQTEDRALQKAIEESLLAMQLVSNHVEDSEPAIEDPELETAEERTLREALELSKRQQSEEQSRREEEEKALAEAIRLSLLDN